MGILIYLYSPYYWISFYKYVSVHSNFAEIPDQQWPQFAHG